MIDPAKSVRGGGDGVTRSLRLFKIAFHIHLMIPVAVRYNQEIKTRKSLVHFLQGTLWLLKFCPSDLLSFALMCVVILVVVRY